MSERDATIKHVVIGFAVGWVTVVVASAFAVRRATRLERDAAGKLGLPGSQCCIDAAAPDVQENVGMVR